MNNQVECPLDCIQRIIVRIRVDFGVIKTWNNMSSCCASCIMEYSEEDVIKVLLKMSENSSVNYNEDISFSIMDSQAEMRARLNAGGINGNPRYTTSDYARELKKYIATPMDDNALEFMFNIKALKPSEKKWLGAALLIKPLTNEFELSYSIKSKQSDGDLSGTLKYKCEK